MEAPAFLADDIGFLRLTQPGGRFDQRSQHRRQVKGGTTDDLEHVGRRCLLPQRFGQSLGALLNLFE